MVMVLVSDYENDSLLLLLGVTAVEWMEGEGHVASFGLHDALSYSLSLICVKFTGVIINSW